MKNKMFYIMMTATMLSTAACRDDIPVTGVRLDRNEVMLNVGESVVLNATVIPEDATDKTVYWGFGRNYGYFISTNIVTVSSAGRVTGIEAGSEWICLVTRYGAYNAYCYVSVVSLTTDAVTTVSATTATLGGNITNRSYAELGVCYSTTSNPTVTDNKTVIIKDYSPPSGSSKPDTKSFSTYVTGLTPNTKYYVRAYAISTAGTVYGKEVSFKTLLNSFVP
jgi:hypothetical protein